MIWLFACTGLDATKDAGTGGDTTPTTPTTPPVVYEPFAPAPATLYRLTEPEWRNAVEDLLGVRYEGVLPVDYLLYNYSRVGGSELTIPPLDLELYEAGAWSVAIDLVPDDAAAEAVLGCDPSDLGCVRGWTADKLLSAWRRPPTPQELDELQAQYETQLLQSPELALQATIASVLMAPDFLFRVELGETDPDHPGWRRYTGWEMAGRLGSLLLTSIPDAELLRAADAGELLTDAGITAQAERLLDTPRGRAAMETFFAETMELSEIESVTKDSDLYPEWTAELRAQAVSELTTLFGQVAFEQDADLGLLLTDTSAVVGPELAALYGLSASGPDTLVQLPADRGGMLGRAAFLSIQAHNTTTSPTFRGKFVQTKLLCENIPPPPPGVVTDLEPLPGGTLREQLEQHEEDPACAGCHVLIDPPGFALEHYDPIGRWRDLDNGQPIDATGDIDDVPFDGAAELAGVVAANPKYPHCIATEAFRFATAQFERPEDLGTIDAIGTAFLDEDGERFKALMVRILLSDAFRKATAPIGDACPFDGATQACASACGYGIETCTDGVWRNCTAPAEVSETCNGVDDDCDGAADDIERPCDTDTGPGTQACEGGSWASCEGPGPGGEVCNGVDDDLDGATDEGMDVNVVRITEQDLTDLGHYSCDANFDAYSPACHAATSRYCAGQAGCGAVTGYGPVVQSGGQVDLGCMDGTQAIPRGSTFTELSTYHADCNQGNRQGGPCNAAISRFCNTLGQTTGFGPVENYADNATIVCTPQATVLNAYYSILSGYDAECNTTLRWGFACNHAIHEWCRDQGFETGHGPLENNGDLAVVACMGVL